MTAHERRGGSIASSCVCLAPIARLEAFFLELPQSRVRELGHPAVGGIGYLGPIRQPFEKLRKFSICYVLTGWSNSPDS
jgi:hypothetical protein